LNLPDTQFILRKSMQYIVKIMIVFIILVLAIGLARTSYVTTLNCMEILLEFFSR
jgi:hypothetical protein